KRKESINITIIGEGTMESKLRTLIKDRSYIVYIPRVEYEDMPEYYNKSDIFILNSVYDPSPLSIIEAIRTGNIMLVSNVAGNAVEVVRNGVNGFTIDPYNENDLKSKFENILDWNEETIEKAKKESIRIYSNQFESAKCIKHISDFILKKIEILS
ncbi:glycosyltransferase, partial [candidate division WOR-3 bacterium]|nr:glycosyltransferase [candidate division WOR-3 bacterium]